MDILLQIGIEVVRVFNESAIYILFGFFIAGILHSLFTTELITRYLGGRSIRSVILASLAGIPLPLCSCSVLPTAISLRKHGASKGSTLSFLISTPETGADSISLTYALMDPIMTVARPFAALITALSAGIMANFVERKSKNQNPADEADAESAAENLTKAELAQLDQLESETAVQCHSEHCSADHVHHPHQGQDLLTGKSDNKLKELLRYSYVELLDDIAMWLMISIVIAGVISALIPEAFFNQYLGNQFTSMLAMAAIGIPMYMCATSSTPVAVSMILKGLNPGAALVFLLSGPATNAGTVTLVGKFLGRNMLVVYQGTIFVVSMLMGTALNAVYAWFGIDPMVTMGSATTLIPENIKIGASVILLWLILRRYRGVTPESLRLSTQHKLNHWLGSNVQLGDRSFVSLFNFGKKLLKYSPALIIAGYMLSGFYMIEPGETGMLKRFGAVTQKDIKQGLHYRYPYPFETTEINKISQIRRVEIGFRSDIEDLTAREKKIELQRLLTESESLTGDENIVNLLLTVQYSISDFFNYQYKVDNQELLVKNLAESVVRQVIGKKEIDIILTHDREIIEQRVRLLLQETLDNHQAGISIIGIALLDDHAPVNVHQAFRDVASAEEDKNTRINQSHAFRNATLAKARGQAAKILTDAESYREEKINRATGEAANFTQQVTVYQKSREITNTRLYLETVEEILPDVKKFIKPPEGTARSIDLWFQEQTESLNKDFVVPGMRPVRK